jgi:hypothetical protein
MIKQLLKKIFLHKAYNFAPQEKIQDYWLEIKVPIKKGSLDCLLWKKDGVSKGVVILVHPYHKQAKEYFLTSGHPELYFKLGFDVVIFDLNGFGKSDDIDFNFQKNMLDTAYFFKSKLNSKHVIGHGLSFGAAILLTSLKQNHCFDKAIIENCMDEVSNYYKARNKKLWWTILLVENISSSVKSKNQYFRSAEKIKNLQKILLIYSAADQLTTPSMGLRIKNHCAVTGEYHLLQGNHMESISSDPDLYLEVIKKYIK